MRSMGRIQPTGNAGRKVRTSVTRWPREAGTVRKVALLSLSVALWAVGATGTSQATTQSEILLAESANKPGSCESRVCDGIRPGAPLLYERVCQQGVCTPLGPPELRYIGCTMGFLVTDGKDVYVSTAGHCAKLGSRPSTAGDAGTFGTTVYRFCGEDGQVCDVGRDFALIRIDRDKLEYAGPQMYGWAAPAGIFTPPLPELGFVRHFGWGVGVGSALVRVEKDGTVVQPSNSLTQARQGVIMRRDEQASQEFDRQWGEAMGDPMGPLPWVSARTVTTNGDSGSGVLIVNDPSAPPHRSDGALALGIATHLGPGRIIIQRFDANIARASSVLGERLRLWDGESHPKP